MSTFTNTAREVEMPNGDVVILHNGVTENTTSNIKKFKYDDNGHVTESTAADAEDLNLSGYSTPTTGTTAIGTSDDVQTAIGKLDHQSHIDQTNILYSLQTGANNLCPESQLTIVGNSRTKSLTVNLPAGKYYISCNATLSGSILADGVFKNSAGTVVGTASGFANGANAKSITIADTATEFYFYSTDANASFDNLMIVPEVVWNAMDHNFRGASLPNYDLTYREQQDRNALVEVIDEGAKNLFDLQAVTSSQYGTNNATLVFNNDQTNFTVTATSTFGYARILATGLTPNAKYTLSFTVSNRTVDVSGTAILIRNAALSTTLATKEITANGRVDIEFVVPNNDTSVYMAFYASMESASTTNTYTVSDVMVCTKAKYDISPSYEPPALPNTDLTRLMTPFFTVPINHNMIYRGQNLGETFTEAQDTALSRGNFTDLYLGDYWTKTVTIPAFYEVTTAEPADWSTNYTSYYTKSGDTYTPVSGDTAPTWAANTYYERLVPAQTVTLKAVIADFDIFYAGYASTYAGINTHHAAVIVHGFNNVVWNKTNTTAGGYVNSLIHKWLVASVLPQIETWFGSAKVLSHQKLLTNAITGDAASGWAWSSQKISLLSENQMYGSKVWGNSKAANGGYEPGEAFKHLNVFNHIDANLLFGNKNIWLRDIASAVWAAFLDNRGRAAGFDASSTWMAPAALILLS